MDREDLLLLRLEKYGITHEIWPYLTTNKDIISLLSTNKCIRNLCLRINKDVPQEIKIRYFDNINESMKEKILKKIFMTFPNILRLSFVEYQDVNNIYQGEDEKIITTDFTRFGGVGKAMKVLCAKSNNRLCSNLRELNVRILSEECASAFSTLVNITSLNLSNSDSFTDNGVSKIILLTSITSLNLESCGAITVKGFSSIFETLTNIKSLNIGSCRGLDNDGLSKISSLVDLNSLKIDGCYNISDHGLSYLSSLTKITELVISELEQITNEGLSHLSSLINITSLDLFNTGITDLIHLSKMIKMDSLSLSSCNISTNGLSPLSSLINISKLDVSCNSLTDQGLAHISSLTRIKVLEIVNCDLLTGNGLLHLSSFATITTLRIIFQNTDCIITNRELSILSSLLQLRSLELQGCDLTEEGLSPISSLVNLTSLDVSYTGLESSGLNTISVMTKIEHLDLEGNNITDKGLSYLKKLTNMISLNLSSNNLIDNGLSHLSSLTKLKILRLNCCSYLSDLGLRHLRHLTNLKILDINKCHLITDSGFSNICNNLRNLNNLSISWSESVTYKSFKNIIKLENLKKWVINGCHNDDCYYKITIQDEELPEIVLNKLINLEILVIPNFCVVKKGVKGLAYVKSVRKSKGWN